MCIKSHSNQAVLAEVEICPLDVAREQVEVMLWGPVHICKEVSGGPFVKNTTEHPLHHLLGDSYFPRGKSSRRGRPYFQRQQCWRIFCPTHNPLLCCCQVWYVSADLIYLPTSDSYYLPRSIGRIYGISQKGNDSRVEHSSYYNRTWRFQHRLEKYDDPTSSPSV